ncbi:uncharacterized protein OCT59_003966 [Rhizophagus irregularis]|uniref:uncharacterized protein n=1 Tax=Rhizophagus irregularis TaxID=588596 RepID=UPI0019EC7520|nr:hypothetical protein OCT59_003966 [Rhizophagus irregularis]GET51012.1 hypothetical protein RIR_jg19049.t1 [Rhizophagus irregularis DAOM 181602=DAOM 197198]
MTDNTIIISDEDPEQEVDSSGNEGGSQSVYDKSTLKYDELYFEEDEEIFALLLMISIIIQTRRISPLIQI